MWYARRGYDFNSAIIGIIMDNGELINLGNNEILFSYMYGNRDFVFTREITTALKGYFRPYTYEKFLDQYGNKYRKAYIYCKRLKFYKRLYGTGKRYFDIHMIRRINEISLAVLFIGKGELIQIPQGGGNNT